MAQVSRPYQIALAALGVFLALWLVALRPKASETSSTPATPAAAPVPAAQAGGAPAQTRLGGVVEKAREGASASQAAEQSRANASDAVEANSTATPGTPASASAAGAQVASAPATAAPKGSAVAKRRLTGLATLPRPLARAVAKKQVIVLLFFNRRAVDDRAVRRAVLSINRRRGKVAVMTAPIGKLSRFTAITRAVPVLGSPTVVVIDRRLNARALGGLLDREGVDEAVADALRA